MALDSALAEYHREMLDQYDLFFIDTAYQTGDPSYHRTEEHIFRYMERNLRPQEEFPTAGAKDLLGLSTEAVELLQAGVATDDGGTVLQYHIVQYMKDISGLSLAETLLEQGNQLEDLQGRDLEAEWDAAEESLKEEIFVGKSFRIKTGMEKFRKHRRMRCGRRAAREFWEQRRRECGFPVRVFPGRADRLCGI